MYDDITRKEAIMNIFRKIIMGCLLFASLSYQLVGCSTHKCATIDNATPFVYVEPTHKEIIFEDTGDAHDILSFARVCAYPETPKDYCYEYIVKHLGHQPLRNYQNSIYYTIYPLEDHALLYLFFQKSNNHYVLHNVDWGDFRDDVRLQNQVLDKDLPSVILGERKPANCYLNYYSQQEIDKQNATIWEDYHSSIEAAGLDDTAPNHPQDQSVGHIRCLQHVSFDVSKFDAVHWGAYVYDIYTYQDGTGTLYFYHYLDKYQSGKTVYECLQKESIDLSKEEVSSLTSLLETWDFANYPTWNPEELSGMDGETTLIYAQGSWGENLISMWSASKRYPHYQIRTAIENMVRSHITVNEGRIYCNEQ